MERRRRLHRSGEPGSRHVVSVDRDVFAGTTAQLNALLVHTVPGDYNHNGVVDMADYIVWRNTAGSIVNLAADGNNNQVVDAGDYTFWRSHFGQTSGSGAGSGADLSQSSVPEPGTVFCSPSVPWPQLPNAASAPGASLHAPRTSDPRLCGAATSCASSVRRRCHPTDSRSSTATPSASSAHIGTHAPQCSAPAPCRAPR